MTTFAFDRAQQEQIGAIFDENMELPVSIEVWSRKDSPLIRPDQERSVHCEDTIRLARLVAALHPALTVTLYDLDRHAMRAVEAQIDRPPVTVLRGRNGRDVRVIGFWTGQLFPAVVDVITYLSKEDTPLQENSKEALAKIERDINIQVLGAMYDPHSALMLRLCGALAAQSRHVRFEFTELVEFPKLAASREVNTVPVLLLEGRRFLGTWDEPSLVQQLGYVASGTPGLLTQTEPLTTPYYSEADIERMAAANAQQPPGPSTTPSGLYLPR